MKRQWHKSRLNLKMSLFLVLTGSFGGACNNSNSQFQKRATIQASMIEVYDDYSAFAQSDDYESFIDRIGEADLLDEYTAARSASHNDRLIIDGYTLEGVRDLLDEREAEYQSAAEIFIDRADYWDTIEFDPYETVGSEEFSEGLAAIERSLNIGVQDYDDMETLLTTEEAYAIERARIVFASTERMNRMALLDTGSNYGGGSAASAGFAVTGRLSMGDFDAVQCYQLGSYSSAEKIGDRWIAGVDGGTLGTTNDATASNGGGSRCGQIIRITNTATGQSGEFVVADRIWENDGKGGCTYTDKSAADKKTNCTGSGHPQIDISKEAFKQMFGGHNPTPGSFRVDGL